MLPLLTLFTIPEEFATSSTAYVGDLFTDLLPILTLIFGLIIGMWVIKFVLGLVRGKGK